MPEVEVRFCAIVGHKNFAMLVWVHGSRIDVDVRVELHGRHRQPAISENTAQARGGDTLTNRTHDSTRDEDVFCGHSDYEPMLDNVGWRRAQKLKTVEPRCSNRSKFTSTARPNRAQIWRLILRGLVND